MTRFITLLGLTAALAACDNSDHTIVADAAHNDDYNAAAEGNFVLPAAIQASRTYRCADNTIVHVEWLADGKSANIRVGDGARASVVSPEAGKPMTAEGYSLAGAADAGSIRVEVPGHKAQSCKA